MSFTKIKNSKIKSGKINTRKINMRETNMRHRETNKQIQAKIERDIQKAAGDASEIRRSIKSAIFLAIRSRSIGEKTTDPRVRLDVFQKSGYRCYICNRIYNPDMASIRPDRFFEHAQIDHIVPFSKWGPNSRANYLLICDRCNRIKSNKSISYAKKRVSRK